MVRPKRDAPNVSSPLWPVVPCSDPAAEFMRHVAVNLKKAIAGRSLRLIARETGVDHTLVAKILSGSAWVEAITIARLEMGLGVKVWAGDFPAPKNGRYVGGEWFDLPD